MEGASNVVFAGEDVRPCDSWSDSDQVEYAYASNKTASIGRSGVDASSNVFRVVNPPGLWLR